MCVCEHDSNQTIDFNQILHTGHEILLKFVTVIRKIYETAAILNI